TQQFAELLQLRRAQASAALNKAVTLRPDLADAHLALGNLYRDMNYVDLMLKHLRTYFDLKREKGPPPGADPKEYSEEEQDFEDQLKALARDVERRESAAAVAATGRPVMERAAYAMGQGLAGKAITTLLESDIAAFGAKGLALEVELLLRT